MVLRALATAALVAGGTAMSQSPHSATLVLTNGERVTGVITYLGAAASPDARSFQLQTPDGQRVSISADRVAMIDFVGGKPTAGELESLGEDTPHLMTLRNGNSRPGRLIGVIGGEFVRWESPAGAQVDVSIRNVTRVYLNQESALTQFDSETPDARGGSGWTSWLERGFLMRPQVVVDAAEAWTETVLTVKRGERLRFTTTGQIRLSRTPGDTTGPEGRATLRRGGAPLPDIPVGALIARVGADGQPFPIGSPTDLIDMPATGTLLLGINDDTLHDNSGSYRVTIVR